jgi:hypothetical protein
MQYILVHGRGASDAPTADDDPAATRGERQALVSSAPTVAQALQQHRRHRRAPADELLVKVRIGDGMVVAKVEDISIGGLYAPMQREVPFGAFVALALLRPGHDELQLTGVVVADGAKRTGFAVRFEGLDAPAVAALRRVVLEQQVRAAGNDPDVDVAPTAPLASTAPLRRDEELDDLRRRVAALTAENERLRADAADADAAHRLVGRLRLEVERLKASADQRTIVDAAILADIQRNAETAWVAVARVSDAVTKLR